MGWWQLQSWKSDGSSLTGAEREQIAELIKKGFDRGQIHDYVSRKSVVSWAKPEEIPAIAEKYEDKRVRLLEMPDDPDPISEGTEGTVLLVDGAGQLIVEWDDGRNLSLIPGVDKFEIIEEQNETNRVSD